MHRPADTGRDPYEEPIGESQQYVAGEFGQMTRLLERIANFSERQREKAAPDVIDLSPTSGSQIANSYAVKVRLRLLGFLLTGGTGDRFQLSIGSRNFQIFSTGAMPFIEFPIQVDVGVDLKVADITNPSSVAWSFYVFGYPEP